MDSAYEGAGNPGKCGAKPYYAGSRQKLLEEHLEEYTSLKFQNQNQFWFEFFAKWWKRFPWKLDDKEEPPLDDPTKMSQLASAEVGELDKKLEVEAAVVVVSLSIAIRNENDLTTTIDVTAGQAVVCLPIPEPAPTQRQLVPPPSTPPRIGQPQAAQALLSPAIHARRTLPHQY